MIESFAPPLRGRGRAGGRFCLRTARRTVAESLYLLTAPATAVTGLLVVLSGLGVATVGLLVPGGKPVAAGALAPARWFGDLERWRIALVTRPAGQAAAAVRRAGQRGTPATSDPGLWLDVAHALVVLPIALVTAAVTALWWFVGVGAGTSALRNSYGPAASTGPQTLFAGSTHFRIALSLGPMSAAGHAVFGTAVGLVFLLALPLVTRACTVVQARLGQALLSDTSALHRRISGLEQERDTARAQTVAAVSAEATALRRLERDIHDGPQQRLVRLAMELGRAQRHLGTRPEAVREALADAITQAQEALDELRALSRGIAPPVLVDRGLRAAVTALAARSPVPAELDAGPLDGRLDPAVETAAYFVIAEALTNVAKHSHARQCTIGLRQDGGTVRAWVTDDGVGGAALAKGHGLRGLDDRLHSAGGRLLVTSPPGGPTTITAELPCR
jgi:signal transduction histidine kinase